MILTVDGRDVVKAPAVSACWGTVTRWNDVGQQALVYMLSKKQTGMTYREGMLSGLLEMLEMCDAQRYHVGKIQTRTWMYKMLSVEIQGHEPTTDLMAELVRKIRVFLEQKPTLMWEVRPYKGRLAVTWPWMDVALERVKENRGLILMEH